MTDERTAGIKAYWDSRALDRATPSERVTLPDVNQRRLEIECVLQYLPRGQRVLEVGSGNGHSTAALAAVSREVIAIDYSAAMIERAREERSTLHNVRFEAADVLSLPFEAGSFDAVVSQRCLINLASWEDQRCALGEAARVLKAGGCLILQEGSQQGRERLNSVREQLGLVRMGPVAYNLDFDEERLWPFVRESFVIVDIRRFGLYDLISRVLHPLLVSPREPEYDASINQVAGRISGALRGMDDLSREFTALLRRHPKLPAN